MCRGAITEHDDDIFRYSDRAVQVQPFMPVTSPTFAYLGIFKYGVLKYTISCPYSW